MARTLQQLFDRKARTALVIGGPHGLAVDGGISVITGG